MQITETINIWEYIIPFRNLLETSDPGHNRIWLIEHRLLLGLPLFSYATQRDIDFNEIVWYRWIISSFLRNSLSNLWENSLILQDWFVRQQHLFSNFWIYRCPPISPKIVGSSRIHRFFTYTFTLLVHFHDRTTGPRDLEHPIHHTWRSNSFTSARRRNSITGTLSVAGAGDLSSLPLAIFDF